MRFSILYIFLVGSVYMAQAQNFLKRYTTTGTDYLYLSHAFDRDSGYVVLNSAYDNTANAARFMQNILRLDNAGNIRAEKRFYFLPATNADWTRQYKPAVYTGADNSYTLSYHIFNAIDTARSGTVVCKLDSNLNPVWGRQIHHKTIFYGRTSANINGSTYFNLGFMSDSVAPDMLHYSMYQQKFFKVNAAGQTVVSKDIFTPNMSLRGFGGIVKTPAQKLLATAITGTTVVTNCLTHSDGLIMELDTNGTVERSLLFEKLMVYEVYQLNNGSYFLYGSVYDTGCSVFTVIALLNANWQVQWAKRVLLSNTLDLADVVDHDGNIYYYSRSIVGAQVSPYIIQMDYAGNIVNQKQFIYPVLLFTDMHINSAGQFSISTADTGFNLLFQQVNLFSDTSICATIPACAPLMEDYPLTYYPVNITTINNTDTFRNFPLAVEPTSSNQQDICPDAGELDAAFSLTKDTFCTGETVLLVSAPTLLIGKSTWLISGAATDTFDNVNPQVYTLAKPGQYVITHIHTIGFCQDIHRDTLWVAGTGVPLTIEYCDTIFASQVSDGCPVTWPGNLTDTFYLPPNQSAITVQVACSPCNYTYTVQLKRADHPQMNPDMVNLCTGNEFVFDGMQSGLTSIVWYDSLTLLQRTFEQAGVYPALITNDVCRAIDTLVIVEDECPECAFFVPNSFSPNADDNNDDFRIFTDCPFIRTFSSRVFNRWGELVFESQNENVGWNGTYKGNDCLPGVYVMMVTVTYENKRREARSRTFKGSLTLIR